MSQANISVVEAGSFELPTLTIGDYLNETADLNNHLHLIVEKLTDAGVLLQAASDRSESRGFSARCDGMRDELFAIATLTQAIRAARLPS